MKPTNSKERRSSALSFSLLVIVACIPLCLGIYFFTRTETVELKYLRDSYSIQNKASQKSADYTNKMLDIAKEISAVKAQISGYSDIEEFDGDLGSILSGLGEAVERYTPAERQKGDSLFKATSKDYFNGIDALNELCKEFKREVKKLRDDVDERDDEIDRLEDELRDYKITN